MNKKTDFNEFFQRYRNYDYPEGKKLFIPIWSKTPEGVLESKSFTLDERPKIKRYVNKLKRKAHVYFGVGLRNKRLPSPKRGENKDIGCIVCLWTEIDDLTGNHKETKLPATKNEAVKIANKMIPGMKPTVIVNSGGGIHVYWFLKEPFFIETESDRKKAEDLLLRVQNARNKAAPDYKLDPVADLSRIMRIPGSINIKDPDNPKLVKVRSIWKERLYSIDEFEKNLEPLPEKKPKEAAQEVNSNGTISTYPPASAVKVVKKCGFMKHCKVNSKSLTEPEWYAMVTNIAPCKNGKKKVHLYSKSYPGYSRKETDAKISHALNDTGPYTCEYIATKINGKYCKQCGFYRKITSPIVLGYSRDSKDFERAIVENLNCKHACIMREGGFAILNETTDTETGIKKISFSKPSDLRYRYLDKKVKIKIGGKDVEKSIADIFLESEFRRRYRGLVFSPNGDTSGYYNLFQGFPVKPKKGKCRRFWTHVRKVICNGDWELYRWLKAWMARIIQDPGGPRPGTCPVLIGKQGTGKGMFVNHFGKLFGPHYKHVIDQTMVTGRFNSFLADGLLVFCDEGFLEDDNRAKGKLKGLITEDKILMEEKYLSPVMVSFYGNFIIASNDEWVIDIDAAERRYLVLNVSDEKANDHEYFGKLVKEMENGGLEALMYDLMKYDYSKYNLRRIPMTKGLVEQKLLSLSGVPKFWYEILLEGEMPKAVGPGKKWPKQVGKDSFYNAYCQNTKGRGGKTKPVFYKELKKLCPSLQPKRVTVNKNRVQVLEVPGLKACRDEFQKGMGMEISWE